VASPDENFAEYCYFEHDHRDTYALIDVIDQTRRLREKKKKKKTKRKINFDTHIMMNILAVILDIVKGPYVLERQSNVHFPSTLALSMIHRKYSSYACHLDNEDSFEHHHK
jgi:hypothetical protein